MIAKGARKRNSTYIGVIENLNLVEAVIYYSAGRDLQILGKAFLEDSFILLRQDLEKTAYAYSIIELINIFFKHSASEPVFFDFLVYILKFIEQENHAKITFWYFILKLASFMGFRPQFSRCCQCDTENIGPNAYFSFRNGAVICNKCKNELSEKQRVDSEVLQYLERLQKTHYKKLIQINLPARNGENYTDFLLEYLSYHTDQNLSLNGLNLLKKMDRK